MKDLGKISWRIKWISLFLAIISFFAYWTFFKQADVASYISIIIFGVGYTFSSIFTIKNFDLEYAQLGLTIFWEDKTIYIFDVDGTITENDDVPPEIEKQIEKIFNMDYDKKIKPILIFCSGSNLPRLLDLLKFLDKFVKEENRVFISAEQGLDTIDYFTKQSINDSNLPEALTNPIFRDEITKLFVDYDDLVPYNGTNLSEGDVLVRDVEKNLLVLTKILIAKTPHCIGYFSKKKNKMITIEYFRDASGKVYQWCLDGQQQASKACKDMFKKNGLDKLIAISPCGTSLDFFPRINNIAYTKADSIGYLLCLISKKYNIRLKELFSKCVVFGDGHADFDMSIPKRKGIKFEKLDMAFVGEKTNYKYQGRWWNVNCINPKNFNSNFKEDNARYTYHLLDNAIFFKEYLKEYVSIEFVEIKKNIKKLKGFNRLW